MDNDIPHEAFELSFEPLDIELEPFTLEELILDKDASSASGHRLNSLRSSDTTLLMPDEAQLRYSKDGKSGKEDADETEEDIYDHLPAYEATVLKSQVITPNIKAGVGALYRYASRNDLIIIAVSALAAIAAGAALPLATIVFGSIQSSYQRFFLGRTSPLEFTSNLDSLVLRFVYLAVAEFVTTYVATVGFIYTGEHISAKIRLHYLQSCLRQNIGFFDKIGAGEVTTRITDDISLVQEGISEKVSITLSSLAAFVSAFVIGFILNWKLTLVLSSVIVALFLVVGIASKFIVQYTKQSIEAYAVGGSVVEEAISAIRNSIAFGTESRLAKQYDRHLKRAEHFSFRTSSSVAFMFAGMMLVIYLNYGLSFWVGSMYLVQGEIPLSTVLTVMLAIVVGAFNLGNVAPNLQAFGTALAACGNVFSTIDRHSPLDPIDDEGRKLFQNEITGNIRFQNVKHIYPSRPDLVVLNDVTLDIPAGKQTALVGTSGSGKSTIAGLIERFYNPVGGQIFLDGHDISTLNIRWLRQQVSLVIQEPVLFDTTIFDNIRYGLPSYDSQPTDGEEELVINAAKKANAHEFISMLPEGYRTNVGERGFLLSGGQKQRIAIARAIISDPKVLLLDEATSALDTSSEEAVQKALDAASEGRTTITIAHRLSTIKNADNIVVMSEGSIVEQGSHDKLVAQKGTYYNLVKAQSLDVARSASFRSSIATEPRHRMSRNRASMASYSSNRDSVISRRLHRFTQLSAVSSRLSGGFNFDFDDFDPNFAYPPSRFLQLPDYGRVSNTFSARYSSGVFDERIDAKLSRAPTYSSAAKALPNVPEEQQPKDTEGQYGVWTLIKFIASFNKNEWKLMVWGLFWAIVCGCGNPVHAFLFAKQVLTLSVPIIPEDTSSVKGQSDHWSLLYLVLAIAIFIAQIGQGVAFAKCSAILIHKVRDQAFQTMLRQDVAFFDENSAGALTSFLSTEATHVAGLSGATLGTILTVLTTLISSIVLALAFGWKLALVCTAAVPVILGCGFFRFYMLAHFQRRSKQAYTSSASYASEAISAIRTVASLTREADVLKHYGSILTSQQKSSLRSVLQSSTLYAASQSFLFLAFALGFWYGSLLVARHEYDLFHFFVCFISVIYGAQSAGSVFSFAPDLGKTYQAANKLKSLFDQKPAIDTWSQEGKKEVQAVQGAVQFRNVQFQYPTRPGQVLSGLNIDVQPNQFVALVGPSGCGKSTTIALLERFYDPSAGSIFVDGKDIRTLNVNDYRSFIALVSQEPTLYQGTIKENILLGTSDQVSDKDVEHACREANIFDFILSLPEGFETVVGAKGVLLSGGQKQRIAIARALVRNPRILLLDEATSALDSESEHVVQAALEKASKGRTTIAVAHRLSTIQRADVIYVFDQGRIVEQGSHSGLMRRKGRYAELVRHQNLEGQQ